MTPADVPRAGGRERISALADVFVDNASLGLYAEIVQSPEYRAAKDVASGHSVA
jgi:hypothetical protein